MPDGNGRSCDCHCVRLYSDRVDLADPFFRKTQSLYISVFQKFRSSFGSDIFKSGFASFLIDLSSGIVIFFFNQQLLRYQGDLGVSVYGIISNTAIVVTCLSNGICQAAQPIISTNFGAGFQETDRSCP